MVSRRFLVSLLLVVAVAPAWAKRPITHEDVWLMKRVGSPSLSPDGRWVVVAVTEPSYEEDKQRSDLWLVAVDGSAAPRQITFTKGGEGGVAWSPDSRKIVFTAKREGDEASQAYILPLDGGEAQRVTELAAGVSSPQWSPDGARVLFVSGVIENAATEEENKKRIEERKKRKYKVLAYQQFPIRYWDHWLDEEERPRLFVQEARPGAAAKNLLAGSKLVEEPGFRGSPSLGGGIDDLDAAWAPDGKSVVFSATVNGHRGASEFSWSNLYVVSVEGGEPRRLNGDGHSYESPAFTPDGKTLLATRTARSEEKLYQLSRLAMRPWPQDGVWRELDPKLDRSIDSFAVTPDSREIYFTAEEAGYDKVFVVPAAGGAARRAFDLTLGGYAALAIAEKAPGLVMAASWGAMTHPNEVVRIDPRAGRHTVLTEFTKERREEIDWAPPEHFWFTASTGRRIHNMLVLPPAFDKTKKYPLIVFMHGGPHNMWKDQFFLRWNYHFLASPGYVVLMTNYSGSTGFGEEFADAINRDVLRGPAKEINEAADEAIKRYPFIDAARQAAGGASYGGYLANWMEGNTTRYRCLFNHAGLINNESMYGATDGGWFWEKRYGGPVWEQKGQWRNQNPLTYAANFKTPMLVSHGDRDYRVPINQGLEVYKILQRQKVPARLLVFPEENHWLLKGENNKHYFEELFAWLAKYLQ